MVEELGEEEILLQKDVEHQGWAGKSCKCVVGRWLAGGGLSS